ncbi:ribonuclease III [Clostridium luticellarii]|jgi:ribonuclease-3|uniref:Ribonuclease 3 n=1 Tax=Clostridium luticellarii TaxID=1691940 RepID=A0A2T0BRA8_9CLOT|nr:ribonuclease III [Clostridium luticellarii]MCI1943880.1 ribonuclease III [Clostridium luticellarii]MCI1967141.1 ribonuclease III [Clostridium luticellarii]MCI1994508.1 ribonuclease III [Clostridium luticellarii]MCI2038539.1 ribonuclease III [Clostridium luticellarii]PRR86414.1 Ribonuclease 3 [Clostridium luticellarii]
MGEKVSYVEDVEKKLNVCFKDKELIKIALTHSSYANGRKNIKFNERLEFLGDSVLQLCISEYLFTMYKNKPEGELTKKRALIVCENSLYEIAKKWELGKYIKMSRGEELTGGRERTSILADCVEAIIAAVHVDCGYEKAREFIIYNFKDVIQRAMENRIVSDYKTRLQEILQKDGDVSIEYVLIKYDGPPHRRKFYTEVCIDKNILGTGTGYSKKESEQDAAHNALSKLSFRAENRV